METTPKSASRRTVTRLTRILAALAAAATAVFGAAAATTGHNATAGGTAGVSDSSYDDSGYDNGLAFDPPDQALSPAYGAPAATTGGS
jgi:hypothetical protein